MGFCKNIRKLIWGVYLLHHNVSISDMFTKMVMFDAYVASLWANLWWLDNIYTALVVFLDHWAVSVGGAKVQLGY
jgi:divalent metal cation (Fe/Co/Zn/Cd) transporter